MIELAAALAPLAAPQPDMQRIWLILGMAGGGLLVTCIVATVVALTRRRTTTEPERE